MSISGNLKTMPFADLLQWILQSRKTGTLVVEGPKYTKKIYFRDGAVIAASSENPQEFLSYYLVGWGYISEDELAHMLELQEKYGTLLGELLVILGRITREELDQVLRVKTEETVYDLFLWPDGEFRFLEGTLPAKKFQALQLPADMLILEGVRRKDEWERIKDVVPSDDHVPKVVRAIDVSSLGKTELSILKEINGKTTIRKIAMGCRMPAFLVKEFVFHGVKAGLMELLPPPPDKEPEDKHVTWHLLVNKAQKALANNDFLAAYRFAQKASEKYSKHRKAMELVEDVYVKVSSALESAGLTDDAVLEIAMPLAELTKLQLEPAEGFLVSRVNGVYTLGELVKLVPQDPMETKIMAWKLVSNGVLKVKGQQNASAATS